MILPNKHEDLNKNYLVIGKDILNILQLKKLDTYNLYLELIEFRSDKYNLNLEKFYNTLAFLFCIDKVEFKGGILKRK
ncbi:MAG: hypothetical protein KC589_11320 [Nanoarchaeota archaeon]|nr:hypothetical protein [Nanoarchaeota archaeon]